MIRKHIKQIILLLGVAQISYTHAFDCSVIYDEFDSLMHKEFLRSPENYVSAVSGELSFEEFHASQKGEFYLRKDRPERGIGIIFSNDKLYGKFVFDWQKTDQLMIEDIIIYNRVEDGYAPTHRGPLPLTPGQEIDLDTGTIFTDADNDSGEKIRADLAISNNSSNPVISSINEAQVYFPTSSLCD